MRYSILAVLTVAAASLGGCQEKKAVAEVDNTPPRLEAVLPNIPMPPGGMVLTSESSKDARRFILTSPEAVDLVVNYYREVLGKPPYRLINESQNSGVTSFYAEQDGPPLWVTVQKNGDAGSMVTIAGAASDSTKATPDPKVKPPT